MEYFFTARRRSGDEYTDKMGTVRYLAVPENASHITPSHEVGNSATWFNQVQHESGVTDTKMGNVVFFVHGFNTKQHEMRARHKKIVAGLEAQGFDGVVISYDWPSDGTALGYASDRSDARGAANFLLDKGIKEFARRQTADCTINLHILAHSMGCFVVREAFDYADDNHAVAQTSWSVSQVALVAADISAKSMTKGSSQSSSLYRHSVRQTNYYSPLDEILSISNVKRVGVARRLGRVGLPDDHSETAVNLYCGEYFRSNKHQFDSGLSVSHTWYFDSPRFYEDLFHTLEGKLDRKEIPTRGITDQGNLALSG